MTWWQIALLTYAGVGVLFFVVIRLSLRSEPTAHGQIVGRQVAMVMLFGWPLLFPMLIWNGVQNAIEERRHRKWVAEHERRYGRGK